MVIVNTVVIVRGLLGGTDSDVAIALACFGGGSMAAALMLPRLLDRIADRAVMLTAATALGITLLGFAGVMSASPPDRPAVLAAQFALSHACWLLTYPLAGWLGPLAGIVPTALALATITFGGVLLAFQFWPAEDSDVVPHQHPELPSDHPHLHGEPSRHAHAYVIDNLHHRWP